jgi:3-methyladenine DNA glycosylase AlkD
MSLNELKKEIMKLKNPMKAKLLQRFFKTGKDEYGEGDIFLGIVVPKQRKLVKEFWNKVTLNEMATLLKSKFHEERLVALLILVKKFEKTNQENEKRKIFELYLRSCRGINSWDLVDLSAPRIVGQFLIDKNRKEREILYEFANSDNLWKKRISVLGTFWFIKENQFEDALRIAEILVERKEKHDLIHKAVGWMLREIGKKNLAVEEKFLKKYCRDMPRTMLRYAIEKFDGDERRKWLS